MGVVKGSAACVVGHVSVVCVCACVPEVRVKHHYRLNLET